jgi:hypothetical protein
MNAIGKVGSFALACALSAIAAATAASAQSQIKVGTLTCHGKGGPGYVIGSQKSFACSFASVSGRRERYSATITRIGLDVGVTGATTLVWAVFAPSSSLKPGVLAGEYAGASADVAIAVGGGANVLVGGSKNSIALQPLSVQGQSGLNLAVGVSSMILRPAR